MPNRLHIDESRADLLIASMPPETDHADIVQVVGALERYRKRGQTFAFMIDAAREKNPPPGDARDVFVNNLRTNADGYRATSSALRSSFRRCCSAWRCAVRSSSFDRR